MKQRFIFFVNVFFHECDGTCENLQPCLLRNMDEEGGWCANSSSQKDFTAFLKALKKAHTGS